VDAVATNDALTYPEAVLAAGTPVHFSAGSVLFRPGDLCSGLLLVRSGSVRVQLVSETGRQITLYRVSAGVACVLSTQCLMTEGAYPAEGVAETDVEGVFLGAGQVQRLLREDSAFRAWMFGVYGSRLVDLVMLVEDLLETRIDRRLAHHLVAQAGKGPLAQTHQAIAADLGTAREVVSRHLKDFERRGLVALGRGQIAVVDQPGLAALAGEPVRG
jgi:CRP/FNR family transcriptional regulator, anaerobic regulatory protein